MKILVLGGSGMLGHRIWIELSKKYETIATLRAACRKINLPCILNVDVFDFESLERTIKTVNPDLVIN